MTLYVGELARITATAASFSAVSVAPADITSMKVTIYDSARAVFLAERSMAWQATEKLWYYLWLTTMDALTPVSAGGVAIPAGSYRAKVELVDLDGHPSWEYFKIRLARNPVGA